MFYKLVCTDRYLYLMFLDACVLILANTISKIANILTTVNGNYCQP
jgi:hypothetical protein